MCHLNFLTLGSRLKFGITFDKFFFTTLAGIRYEPSKNWGRRQLGKTRNVSPWPWPCILKLVLDTRSTRYRQQHQLPSASAALVYCIKHLQLHERVQVGKYFLDHRYIVLFLEVLCQTKRNACVHEIFKPFPFRAPALSYAESQRVTLSNELMNRNRCDRRTDGRTDAT